MATRIFTRNVVRDAMFILFGIVMGLLLARVQVSSEQRAGHSDDAMTLVKRGEQTAGTPQTHAQQDKQPSPSEKLPKRLAIVEKKWSNQPVDTSLSQARPKTVADELHTSMRKPLFIAVVTAQSLLATRATAVNKTWGAKAPNLAFFSSQGETSHGLPVVSLPGVDDTYPPQKKVFRMLKHLHDNYINEYNWFMRVDDDLYVRVEPLIHFLSKFDPNTELYLGQPGAGKAEDLQRIKLYTHEHYCMGGPGVIFSRALLIKLAPHLEDCLQHEVVSWNEDLEVGRCISRRLGVQCTWNYEMAKLFYNDYSKGKVFKTSAVYEDNNLPNALTVHSFKEPLMMYKVHQFFQELAVGESEKRTTALKSEVEKMRKFTGRKRAFA